MQDCMQHRSKFTVELAGSARIYFLPWQGKCGGAGFRGFVRYLNKPLLLSLDCTSLFFFLHLVHPRAQRFRCRSLSNILLTNLWSAAMTWEAFWKSNYSNDRASITSRDLITLSHEVGLKKPMSIYFKLISCRHTAQIQDLSSSVFRFGFLQSVSYQIRTIDRKSVV